MRKFKFRYYEKDEERGTGMKYAEPDITNMEYFLVRRIDMAIL